MIVRRHVAQKFRMITRLFITQAISCALALLCCDQHAEAFQKRCIVYVIHGTLVFSNSPNSNREAYDYRGSSFAKELRLKVEGYYGKNFVEIRAPRWSGGNSHRARLLTANILADDVSSIPEDVDVHIIAHSHGGNIALAALPYLTRRISSITLLATPIFMVSLQNDKGEQYQIPLYIPGPFALQKVGLIINAYSPSDDVQQGWSEVMTGVSEFDTIGIMEDWRQILYEKQELTLFSRSKFPSIVALRSPPNWVTQYGTFQNAEIPGLGHSDIFTESIAKFLGDYLVNVLKNYNIFQNRDTYLTPAESFDLVKKSYRRIRGRTDFNDNDMTILFSRGASPEYREQLKRLNENIFQKYGIEGSRGVEKLSEFNKRKMLRVLGETEKWPVTNEEWLTILMKFQIDKITDSEFPDIDSAQLANIHVDTASGEYHANISYNDTIFPIMGYFKDNRWIFDIFQLTEKVDHYNNHVIEQRK